MRIVTYNVNGIRAAMNKGLITWLEKTQPDICCFQEVKAMQDQVDLEPFTRLGYTVCWHHAEKKGYSGVATITKLKPDKIVEGIGIARFDQEGRVLRTDFGDITLLNCYFPSGTTGDIRQKVKYEFLDAMYQFSQDLINSRSKCILVGDINIAHTEQDIHDPKGNKKSSGFLPEERAWLSKWLDSGWTDSFRFLNPTKIEYSWWAIRANARANNKGWRIDSIYVTNDLQSTLQKTYHDGQAVHSDHCPVVCDLKLKG